MDETTQSAPAAPPAPAILTRADVARLQQGEFTVIWRDGQYKVDKPNVGTIAVVPRFNFERLRDSHAALLDRVRTLEAGLRDVIDGAPDEEPEAGEWTTYQGAFEAGEKAQHYECAELARLALLGPCVECGEPPEASAQVALSRRDTGQTIVQSAELPLCEAHARASMAGFIDLTRHVVALSRES